MKPYYDEGGIQIFHGDCREVLPLLPRESCDVLITDPPYGVEWRSGLRQNTFAPIAGDHSTECAIDAMRLAFPALKECAHVYVFGRYDLAQLDISSAVELIWDKTQIGPGDLTMPWGPQHEPIQFFVWAKSKANRQRGDGRLSARMRRGSVLRYPRLNSNQVASHPTEKPVRLMQELIESSSVFGDVILDPFAGSGSTLLAAHLEGRRAIGIEIEERYCEIAVNRLRQGVLFGASA